MVSLLHLKRDIDDWRRMRHIAAAFAMGGFSYYLKRIGLGKCVSLKCKVRCLLKRGCTCPTDFHSLPVHFRKVIEGLGPTFIKLGQLLSLRPDVIPAEYCEELRKLQEQVPGFSFAAVKKIVEEDMGKPISKIFASFEKEPLAAASIAQVHVAKLKNGKKVAVKVLRPNVRAVIEQDIRIMEFVAAELEKHYPESRPFRPRRFVEEFKDWTMREVDFRNEGTVMQEMAQVFENDPLLKIPRVYAEQSSSRVLTMEFIDGVHIDDQRGLNRLRTNRKQLAVNAVRVIVQQTLVHGLFHGDPHPGNILVLKGNRFGFLDFGIIGRLTARQRRKMSVYLVHLFERDFERALKHILDLAETSEESDVDGFKRRVRDILSACYGTLKTNSLSQALYKSVIAGVPHKVYFPADLVLLSKAFVTIESVGREIYPEFSLLIDAKTPVEEELQRQLTPIRSVQELVKNSLDYADLIEELPAHAANLLKIVEKGGMSVTIDTQEFTKYLGELHHAHNVRVLGMIIGALIVGSAITSFISAAPAHMLSLQMIELYLAGALGIVLTFRMRKR